MDPVTQGVLGASASQLVASRREKMAAAIFGMLSGMAADLDVLIRSPSDPLFALEYHRHFTHALVFIPFGALICALVFRVIAVRLFKRNSLSFKRIYLFCFAGYATHAVLDACTTYGTQLLWPFSDARIAWNNVSVIDPLFTLPLMIIVACAVFKRSNRMAWLGASYAVFYLGLGLVQNHRAEALAHGLAESRGHQAINLGVKPSFANILVWKSVYEHQGRYYVDAVRVGVTGKIYKGESIAKLDLSKHLLWLDVQSQQARDIERFRWFSNQHLGLDPNNPNRVIDVRYSAVPNQIAPLWGITLSPTKSADQHVEWTTSRPQGAEGRELTATLWSMIRGL